MASDEKVNGGCMCGAVRYEAIGKPDNVAYCHCSDCRGITGAPVVAWVVYETRKVSFVRGKRKIYESSPGLQLPILLLLQRWRIRPVRRPLRSAIRYLRQILSPRWKNPGHPLLYYGYRFRPCQ